MPPGLPMSGRGMPGLGRWANPLALMPSGAAQSGVTAAGKVQAPRGGSAAAVTDLHHLLLEREGRCILSHLAVPLCLRQGSLHSLAEEDRRCLP